MFDQQRRLSPRSLFAFIMLAAGLLATVLWDLVLGVLVVRVVEAVV